MGETTPTPADTLGTLIRFDTTNPPGDEGPCLDYLTSLFQARGIACLMMGASAERPNLVVRVPGRGQAPPLLMQATSTWLRPPASVGSILPLAATSWMAGCGVEERST